MLEQQIREAGLDIEHKQAHIEALGSDVSALSGQLREAQQALHAIQKARREEEYSATELGLLLDAANKQLSTLREALRPFTVHVDTCIGAECNCGLEALLAQGQETREPERAENVAERDAEAGLRSGAY